MQHAVHTRLGSFCLVAALGLSACDTTKTVEPTPSQAVAEARARRNAPAQPTCPTDPVSSVSPVTIGFAFNDDELTQAMSRSLDRPAQWLGCHPAAPAVILPDADGHGSPSEQDALARRRGERVRAYLAAHGVPAQQIRILARAGTEPTGQLVLIRAEGRRW